MNAGEYLEHHGILGQRWGVRRFQNPDGSLTKAGQKRYGTEGSRTAKQTQNRLNDVQKAIAYNKRDLRNKEETISTFKNKKGSNDFQKKVIKDKEEIKKRIEAGDKEIDNIIKKSGDYKITSKDIKQNTTPGAVRTYQTLAIVGSVPLSIVPGPNMALIGAVSYKVATNNANKVDSKKYKVEDKENKYGAGQKVKDAINRDRANMKLDDIRIREAHQLGRTGYNDPITKALNKRDQKMIDKDVEKLNKITSKLNSDHNAMMPTRSSSFGITPYGGGIITTYGNRYVSSNSKKYKNYQSETARRNAAEQLRYGEGKKSRQLAAKEISKMNDKDLKSEIKSWRESAEYHRKNGDNDTAKQWEQNAKLYENELNKRRL